MKIGWNASSSSFYLLLYCVELYCNLSSATFICHNNDDTCVFCRRRQSLVMKMFMVNDSDGQLFKSMITKQHRETKRDILPLQHLALLYLILIKIVMLPHIRNKRHKERQRKRHKRFATPLFCASITLIALHVRDAYTVLHLSLHFFENSYVFLLVSVCVCVSECLWCISMHFAWYNLSSKKNAAFS